MTKEKKNKPLTLLVAGTAASYLREPEEVFERSAKFRVRTATPETIDGIDPHPRIDAVVLSIETLGEAEHTLLSQIHAIFGDVPVVILSDHLNDSQLRELIHFQVDDWLTRPLEAGALISAVENGVRTSKTSRNTVHAVISGHAGAGATVIAASLADLLTEETERYSETIALFDLDFSTGDCGYVLNMINTYDLKTVLAHPERIDVEFTNLIQERHRHGFFVYSFKRPELITNPLGSELVLRMLDAVNVQHDHTVLDIPYYQTDWRNDVFAAVNTCTIITEPNLPALRQSLDTLNAIYAVKGDKTPVHIIINKSKRHLFGSGIGAKDIRNLFGDTPIWTLPYDGRLIEESLNRGVLPAQISPRARFIRALQNYLEALLEPGGTGQ